MRVGIVVGRRVGKAATRNRVKRRIREAVRALHAELRPGYDVLVIARPPAANASSSDLAAGLAWLLDRAGVRAVPGGGLEAQTGADGTT